MGKKYKVLWRAVCTARDERRGCFHADFEGCCTYKSKPQPTQEKANEMGERHTRTCKFGGRVHTYQERKYESS